MGTVKTLLLPLALLCSCSRTPAPDAPDVSDPFHPPVAEAPKVLRLIVLDEVGNVRALLYRRAP